MSCDGCKLARGLLFAAVPAILCWVLLLTALI